MYINDKNLVQWILFIKRNIRNSHIYKYKERENIIILIKLISYITYNGMFNMKLLVWWIYLTCTGNINETKKRRLRENYNNN